MEELHATPAKRKIDQVGNEDPNPPSKKIKIANINETKEFILFSDLPPEVHHQFLSYITNDYQRRHIRLVCRLWFDIINYNEFDIGVLLASEADEFYRIFSRYEKPIGFKLTKLSHANNESLLNANLLTAKQIKQTIKKLTQLTSLDLRLFGFNLPKKMTNLQALTTMHPIRESISANLTNLTRLKTSKIIRSTEQFPPSSLESLNFDGFSFQSTVSEIKTRVTELKVSTVDDSLFNAFPNLKKLEIRHPGPFLNHNIKISTQLPNLEKLVTNVILPSLYGSNLTNLQILTTNPEPTIITSNLTYLKKLKCQKIELPENNRAALLSLESCEINDASCNQTILNYLNSEKIRQLQITATQDNFPKLVNFTRLADLTLTINNLVPLLDLTLPFLTKLHLTYTAPYGQLIGRLLYQLTNLVDLSLRNYSRRNPEETMRYENLQHLTALRITEYLNKIIVSKLTSLQLLEIENGCGMLKQSVKISGLSTLTNLTKLRFKYTIRKFKALKNWSDLAHLTKLRELNVLQEYHPGDITNLTTLQQLTYLEVESSSSQSLECLTTLSRLQCVNLKTEPSRQMLAQEISNKLPFCYSFVNKQ